MINVGAEEYWLFRTLGNASKVINESTTFRFFILWAVLFLAVFSSVIGTFLGAVLADRYGRRRILLATSIFAIVQIIGASATNVVVSCVTLFFGEIGVGITRVVVPLYVSEIVDDKIRGALLMLQLPFIYVGKLIVVSLSDTVSTVIVSCILTCTFTIIFIAAFIWFPETPYYLATKNNDIAEAKSLSFYRGITKITADDEVEVIIKNVESCRSDGQGVCEKIRELVMRPSNRKGLMIVLFLIIAKWSENRFDIHNDSAHGMIDSLVLYHYHARIIAYVISLITAILMVFTSDAFGRRSYLLYSTSLAFVLIVFVLSLERTLQYEQWVNEGIVIIFHFCELVIFSVSSVYAGEFFSANVRALAIAIVTAFNLMIGIVIVTLFATMRMDPSAYCAAIFLLSAFPITLAFVPETKRKCLTDIQTELATTFHCKWLMNRFSRIHRTR